METLPTIEIKGREYQVDPFDFDDSWLLLVRIVGLLAPSLGRITSIADAVNALGSIELAAIPPALLSAGTGLLDQLFARTYWLDGSKRVRLDAHGRTRAFARDLHAAAKVAYFILETNYSDSIRAIAQELQSP